MQPLPAAGTGTRAAATAAELQIGVDSEAHVGHVNGDGRSLSVEALFDNELVAVCFHYLVLIVWLIQSQCQPGAGSTAG